jgi:hypothetical protein
MIEIRTVKTQRELKQFMDLPKRIYANDPAWVPALDFELKKQLSRTAPFFEHGDAELFTAWRGGQMVGRISAQYDRLHNERYSEKTAFFGFFETEDDETVSRALFDAAVAWARKHGMNLIRGPFSFSINHIAGCLIEGFETPPYLDMAHNLPYYPKLIEAYGFTKAKDLIAFRYDATVDPPEMAQELAKQVEATPGLVIREVRKSHFEEDLGIILSVFNEAWSQNWGFVPMTDAEVKLVAENLKLVLDPRLAFIAEFEGEPAGVCVTIPNINQLLHKTRGLPTPLVLGRMIWDLKVRRRVNQARLVILGVRRKFRGSALGGLSVLFYVKTHFVGQACGMTEAELSWTLEDNYRINQGIEMMGGKPYKLYRVYDLSLGDSSPA